MPKPDAKQPTGATLRKPHQNLLGQPKKKTGGNNQRRRGPPAVRATSDIYDDDRDLTDILFPDLKKGGASKPQKKPNGNSGSSNNSNSRKKDNDEDKDLKELLYPSLYGPAASTQVTPPRKKVPSTPNGKADPKFAGSSFHSSPAPSSLPVPARMKTESPQVRPPSSGLAGPPTVRSDGPASTSPADGAAANGSFLNMLMEADKKERTQQKLSPPQPQAQPVQAPVQHRPQGHSPPQMMHQMQQGPPPPQVRPGPPPMRQAPPPHQGMVGLAGPPGPAHPYYQQPVGVQMYPPPQYFYGNAYGAPPPHNYSPYHGPHGMAPIPGPPQVPPATSDLENDLRKALKLS